MRKVSVVLILTILMVSAIGPGEGQEGEEEGEIILKETRITDDSAHQLYPDIWGDIITWTDYRSDTDGNIYLIDLSTRTEREVVNASGIQRYSKISTDMIVWEDRRSSPYRIFYYQYLELSL